MGAKNAISVSDQYADLPDIPFRVLIRMALHALDPPGKDSQPPLIYSKGRDPLLHVANRGKQVPTDAEAKAEPSAMKVRKARLRVLDRAVDALIEVKAIKRLSAGRRGHNAEYLIVLPRHGLDHAQNVVLSDELEPRLERGPNEGDRTTVTDELGPLFDARLDHAQNVVPREVPLEEVLLDSAAERHARAKSKALAGLGATADEEKRIIEQIRKGNGSIKNMPRYLAKMAENGDLATMLDRVRLTGDPDRLRHLAYRLRNGSDEAVDTVRAMFGERALREAAADAGGWWRAYVRSAGNGHG